MSERRRARAAASSTGPATDAVLEVLRDVDHPIWADQGRFLAFMAEHGWAPGVVGHRATTAPANRRNAASAAWGVENGITTKGSNFADWHALRRMGLIGEGGGLGALERARQRAELR